MSVLNDINGKESAKRKWGGRFLGVGLGMAIIYFGVWVYAIIINRETLPAFPYEMWYALVGTGLTSIGITLFERKNK